MSLNEREWITEVFENRTAFSVRFSRKLYDEVSDFQRIQIFETEPMGRVLILNGCFMVTEQDAFMYHEMLVHPAMRVLSNPLNILVIGGGDGGAVTELVKYPSVESVTLCEIDPLVVKSCRDFFPRVSQGLNDPRVKVVIQDGASFVRNSGEQFDLILIDSTDPVGPGKALFEVPFYESIKGCLRGDCAAVFQTEGPVFMPEVFCSAVLDLRKVFGSKSVYPYFATIPCYPGGLWSFSFCSDRVNPTDQARINAGPGPRGELSYFSREIHEAAFAMPIFVKKSLDRADG
jgi:spermidine synthase